jgi:hypothetical protein
VVFVRKGIVEVFKFTAIGWFFKSLILARTFSGHVVVVSSWTRLAKGTWQCVLILKGTSFALLAGGAIFVAKFPFATRLAFGGSFGTGFAGRAIFTQFIGCRTAFCSSWAYSESGGSFGIDFGPKRYNDRR